MNSESDSSPNSRRHAGYWVVAGLMALSVVVGVVSYRNYDISEKHLMGVLEGIERKGGELDAMQCVDEVLAWAPNCEAMKSLCEASVPRIMDRCLSARPREEDCNTWAPKSEDPKFVYAACKERGIAKHLNKVCGNAYKAIGQFCRAHKSAG